METNKIIDLKKVFAAKLPGKTIPGFVIRLVEKILCVDDINRLLTTYGNCQGKDFTDCLIKDFNCRIEVVGRENLPEGGRYLFTSNHPLGAFDGISYISILGAVYPDVKVIVNDILYNLAPLRPVFLPVNTLGRKSRHDLSAVEEACQSATTQVMTFPAGFCSRFMGGRITDTQWRKSAITMAVKNKRDIVPMYFHGRNSILFYFVEWLRRVFGMKFNIGLFLLPREAVRNTRNKHYTIYIGKPIPWQTFTSDKSDQEWTQWLRDITYGLRKSQKS